MEEREKAKKMFNLIIRFYIDYKRLNSMRKLYYDEYDDFSKLELSSMNYHIPEMVMSKKSFNSVLSTGSFIALVEFILTKNVPFMTLASAFVLYMFYIDNRKAEIQRQKEYLYSLKSRCQIKEEYLKDLVCEIGKLSRELNYDVTLHTNCDITDEYIQCLIHHLQYELDRMYPCHDGKNSLKR